MATEIGTIKHHFKEDIGAAFGMALVVLPLALGIAIASGVPPMSGVIAAVVGGIVTTFFRDSNVTINGPSAGLIVVMLSGLATLNDGDTALAFQYLLAAIVIAGFFQIILGLLRLGEIGDMIPAASIHGMLAAVGIMILSTQIYVALGISPSIGNTLELLKAIPRQIPNLHPIITIISIISACILIAHSKVNNKIILSIPTTVWIIIFTVPIIYYFNFSENQVISIFYTTTEIGPQYLVQIPDDIWTCIIFPNFGKINQFSFWMVVLSITTISSIETLVSTKAVDKLDTLERHSNLNKELFAVGISSIISGMIGGLPIITAIPIHNGAKTKWSNLYYGIFLLLFIILFASLIQLIPLAALAVLLVYTGYKLATPKVWIDIYRKGDDQFLIFASTLIAALGQGLLIGILVGILTTLFIHYTKSNLEPKQFFNYLKNPSIESNQQENTELYINLKGIVNFINIPQLKKILRAAATEKHIILDMSHARLIDYTVLEYLHDDAPRYDIPGVEFEIVGLGAHETSSRHPNATRILPEDKKPQLNKRQEALEILSKQNNGTFWPEIRWDLNQFKDFHFFKSRTIEYSFNTAKGHYKMFFDWESCDITFEEGGLFSSEKHTSVIMLHLPFDAPAFVLQQEGLVDKLGVKLALQEEDINFPQQKSFSDQFLLQGPNPEAIKSFFNDDLINYIKNNPYYHIESNGSVILIFKEMRFSSPSGMTLMQNFSQEFANIMLANWKKSQALELEALML